MQMNKRTPVSMPLTGSGLDRREFMIKGGALATGLGLMSRVPLMADEVKLPAPSAAKLGWQVSVQGYTYRRFSLFEALPMASEIGLRHFEIRTDLKLDNNRPGMNANENMPDDARKELKTRLADNGLSVPTIFTDFDGKPDQAKRLFDFWKDFGTEVFTAEPPKNKECIDMLEKLCDEYKIKLALHNHQRERSEYWCPEIVLEVCEGRGCYVGSTADGGQWARSNLDPVECLKKLEGRVHNFHLKDILTKGELFCRNTVIGEGEGACAESLKELARQGYKGCITIDFEHDTPALQEDMAKNIAFIENQAKQLLA
jgi:L-ribulose-5-phosphate 3-epimerase